MQIKNNSCGRLVATWDETGEDDLCRIYVGITSELWLHKQDMEFTVLPR